MKKTKANMRSYLMPLGLLIRQRIAEKKNQLINQRYGKRH